MVRGETQTHEEVDRVLEGARVKGFDLLELPRELRRFLENEEREIFLFL